MARKNTRKCSQLAGIARKSDGLRRWVARYILRTLKDRGYESNDSGLRSLFGDLSHGCSSGIVSELIYTRDTHRFFNHFYSDIDNLREEYEDDTGETLPEYLEVSLHDSSGDNLFVYHTQADYIYIIDGKTGECTRRYRAESD